MNERCPLEESILLNSMLSASQGAGQPSTGLEFPRQHRAGPSTRSFTVMLCDVTLHSLSALWDFTPISHPLRELLLFS